VSVRTVLGVRTYWRDDVGLYVWVSQGRFDEAEVAMTSLLRKGYVAIYRSADARSARSEPLTDEGAALAISDRRNWGTGDQQTDMVREHLRVKTTEAGRLTFAAETRWQYDPED
jgi:hypothetical protein